MAEKNRKIGMAVWFLAFVLSVYLLWVLPTTYSANVLATFVFDVAAFFSTLYLWVKLYANMHSEQDEFYCTPALVSSLIYLILQFGVCVLTGLVDSLSFKLTVSINFILMAVMWMIILSAIYGKNHAKQVDSRQKDNHTKL